MTTNYTGAGVRVYYVDGENGDDSRTDVQAQTFSTAWQTVQHSFDRTASGDADSPDDGDEIRICATSNDSTYYSSETKMEYVGANKTVIFIGANSSGTVDGTRPTIYGGSLLSTSDPIMSIAHAAADYLNIANLQFDCEDHNANCLVNSLAGAHSLSFINCRFSQATEDGVFSQNISGYWNYFNCEFDNNAEHGLNFDHTGFNMIHNCLFRDNGADGMNSESHHRISDSVFYNNGEHGLTTYNSGSVITNCVFESNTENGMVTLGSGQMPVINCVSTANGGWGFYISSNTEIRLFNCYTHGNGSGGLFETGEIHISGFEFITNSDPGWISESTYDFTPTGDFGGVGGGLSTPFKYFGTTDSDAGIGSFRPSAYQLRANLPRRQ